MWQSNVCNGQQKAFMFSMTMRAVLLFVVELGGDLRGC
ncbi:MAG: DUF2165 domain-containing protein [Mesorhizobium sp.]|nr:MAG: DUF2165 family protein [Mesorhizobium sp.]RWP59782.1 MAG: DUF2165 family protein [Mesorhizobium sp.]TIM26935.1 MAG: DUF2165 domain-containing protein [Mesorhizobium sp.]